MQSMQNAQNSFWNNASLIGIRDRSSRQWIPGEPTFTAPTYRHLLADMWEISDVTEFNNFLQNKLPLYLENIRFRETITHSDANMVPQTGKDYYTQLMLNQTTTEGIVRVKEEFLKYKREWEETKDLITEYSTNVSVRDGYLNQLNNAYNIEEIERIKKQNIDLLKAKLIKIADSITEINQTIKDNFKARANETNITVSQLNTEIKNAQEVHDFAPRARIMINEYQSYYETNNSINNADPNYQTHRDEFERRIVALDTYQKTVEFEQYYDSIRYTDEYVLDTNYGVRLDNVNNSNNVRVSVLFNTVQNKPIVLTFLI
ncbi:hypothetical protein [Mycoplasmopsis felis]|uniref:hypothetical protein n=1 Tax=Mycoplasmopsis felis TaxID=33923 RepID=UPI002B002E8D|nr:hypothetical protein [Mycoplasmopsis felis]WQQ03550.1 hypothetical protein RRG38_01690 [Mycoplasmopsis felis]